MEAMTPLELALIEKIKTDADKVDAMGYPYRNRLYVYNLLWFKARGMDIDDVEQAAIDEYIVLYGNPLAPKPQGILKI